MSRISPTWPTSGQHDWAGQLNSNLDGVVAQTNTHDDMLTALINGIDGGNAAATFNGSVNFDGGGAAG